jgi:hypothetical protein
VAGVTVRPVQNRASSGFAGAIDSGLLAITAVCNVAAFATLCIHHDKELEQAPILDDTAPTPGNVAEIVRSLGVRRFIRRIRYNRSAPPIDGNRVVSTKGDAI